MLATSKKLTFVGQECNVLSIEGLLRSKRAAGRPKDLMAIPELEALLELEQNEDQNR